MSAARSRSWLLIVVFLVACPGGGVETVAEDPSAEAPSVATESFAEPDPIPAEPPAMIAELLKPFRGDFDAMNKQRVVRVLVTHNRTNFFLDGGTQRGLTADLLREFERHLNKELKLGRRPLHVAAVPVPRDQLIPFLEQGRGDMAIASLTITAERLEQVDFTVPAASNISELVVTGPGSPEISSIEDLAGKRVHVRPSSSYHESLQGLNADFRRRGLEEIEIAAASEYLETEDLLEMVNAGLIEITVADDYLASFWAQALPNIVVHEKLAIASGRNIGWAVRKDAPELLDRADTFVRANRQGRLLGNMLINRYLKDATYIKNALGQKDRQRFDSVIGYFQEYGDVYDFDYLMVAAQGYQESGLDQTAVSRAGAVGIMQLLPSTAAHTSVGIADISTADRNIHAGIKYLRYIVDNYFDDPEIDDLNRTLFAFAAYNAGPNRIRRLRAKAAEQGYDPRIWFQNVEVVVANEVGREPVQYVSNIFKYYTVYSLLTEQQEIRQQVKQEGSRDG